MNTLMKIAQLQKIASDAAYTHRAAVNALRKLASYDEEALNAFFDNYRTNALQMHEKQHGQALSPDRLQKFDADQAQMKSEYIAALTNQSPDKAKERQGLIDSLSEFRKNNPGAFKSDFGKFLDKDSLGLGINNKTLGIVGAGLVGAYGLKKLYDHRKARRDMLEREKARRM